MYPSFDLNIFMQHFDEKGLFWLRRVGASDHALETILNEIALANHTPYLL